MRITDALRGEHGAFYGLIEQVEALAEEFEVLAQIQNAILERVAFNWPHIRQL